MQRIRKHSGLHSSRSVKNEDATPMFSFYGKFGKDELLKRMAEAEEDNLDDCTPVDEISMIDLLGKKLKTVKHCFVD